MKKDPKIKPKKQDPKPETDIPMKPDPDPAVKEEPEINDPRIDDPPPTKPEQPIKTKSNYVIREFTYSKLECKKSKRFLDADEISSIKRSEPATFFIS